MNTNSQAGMALHCAEPSRQLRIDISRLDTTRRLARCLAPHLCAGDVIALHGDLGAGKTSFARGLIRALTETQTEVPSPTYTLLQTYDGPGFAIFHFDLYRLEQSSEVLELGWEETTDGLMLVEWPDRAGQYLPGCRLDMRFETSMQTRHVTLETRSENWHTRLHDLQCTWQGPADAPGPPAG